MKNNEFRNRTEMAGVDAGFSASPWFKWVVIFGFWTVFALLYASQIYFEMLHDPRMHHAWWRIVVWQLVVWYAWGALTPMIVQLGRTLRSSQVSWLLFLIVQIGADIIFSAVHVAASVASRMLIQPFDVFSDTRPFWNQFSDSLTSNGLLDMLVYAAILGVAYAFDYHQQYREREFAASQLSAELAKAQLESLKAQIHPHFLFNALHTIAGLVRANEGKPAVEMIAGLSALLRRAIDSADQQEVTLREEKRFIELYLEIQKVRFADQLQISLDMAETTLSCIVPNLILQPIVENAVRHGIAAQNGSGRVAIVSRRKADNLLITISNDGPRLATDWRIDDADGVGLANTKKRLECLYGDEHRFELTNNATGGVVAILEIPFRLEFRSHSKG